MSGSIRTQPGHLGFTPAELLLDEWGRFLIGAGMKRGSTAIAYRRSLLDFLRVTGTTDFDLVKTADLDLYSAKLRLAGENGGRRIRKSTLRSRLYALRSFFAWAHSRGRIRSNPADPRAFKIPAPSRASPVFVLEFEEIERLVAAALAQGPPVRGKREHKAFFSARCAHAEGRNLRDAAAVLVLYVGALRVSEAAGLRWADVAKEARDGTITLSLPPSKRSDYPEPVVLDRRASDALRAWRAARRDGRRPEDRIFGLSAAGFARMFGRLCLLAEIPARLGRVPTPHAARSSRATHASEAGLSDLQVANLLRQKGTGSVQRYIRAATKKRAKVLAVASLPWNARLLGPATSGIGEGKGRVR